MEEEKKITITNQGRKLIRLEVGVWEIYSVYVAKQNPDICGKWFKGCEVHHIDFDKTNDSPYNLIVLTPKEHHKIHKLTQAKKQVIGWLKDKYLGTFNSMTEAAQETGVSPSSISFYCRNGKPISSTYIDYKWELVSES